MKIMTVVGARPQFVKAAVLSRELEKHKEIQEIIVHTGQHFDTNMSEVFFEEMNIPKPKYNLQLHSLNHGAMTGRMLEGIENLILEETPDLLMVYGDTNSTIAGALAAKKLHVKVAHVEAGLRSFNMAMPEEINRILTDRISDILFCPTDVAVENLRKEGFENFDVRIVKSGDVMQDAAYYYAKMAEEKSTILKENNWKNFILVTIHRAENTNDRKRLNSIVTALNELGKSFEIVLPLHPRTKKIIDEQGLKLDLHVIDPVGYFDMLQLLTHCSLVMTDSGGLQKEAFFFRKPCVTLRDQTEWLELVNGGFNILAGADKDQIIAKAEIMMKASPDFNVDLYGGGKASERIANELLTFK